MKRQIPIVFMCLATFTSYAQEFTISTIDQGKETSIRGLSVLDDSVAWVSGSGGWVGKSIDSGRTWDWKQVSGYEGVDFRDIESFSDRSAIILSAGSPLVILLTVDGGGTWEEVYQDSRPEIFFDGMDFWDEQCGIAYGDPIDGIMQLLKTNDGGRNWQDISRNAGVQLVAGEAGFAASGTGIRTLPAGNIFIASGGYKSQLFHSADSGYTWKAHTCPIVQGAASTGIFSIAFLDENNGVAVGGDYQQDDDKVNVVFVTDDGGANWQPPKRGTNGYRSAVEYIDQKTLIATGTSGVDISVDGGKSWTSASKAGFHVVRKAKFGTWVVLAGANGKVAVLQRKTKY